MAFILKDSYFNPDDLEASVIGIASDFTNHDSGLHQHEKAQFLYAPSGCITVISENKKSILPPTMGVWLPANFPHRVITRNVVAYRSIYFDTVLFPEVPVGLTILNVNNLLKEIIEKISFWEWDMPFDLQKNVLSVFWEEFYSAAKENLTLIVPQDLRIKPFVEHWNLGESLPPFLKKLAIDALVSEKTIGRIFLKETGMSYQEWRQQWRLQKAIELLAEGKNVGETAYALEFSSDSAFIEFFKKYLRATPMKYFQ